MSPPRIGYKFGTLTSGQGRSLIGLHYSDVIMGAMASQITSLTIVYSTVYSADQRKHQSSASLAFVRGIHRRKFFHLMTSSCIMLGCLSSQIFILCIYSSRGPTPVGEGQNFVTDPMLHGSHCSSLNTGLIWSNLHLLDIILAALFWQHCSRSMWDCFAPYTNNVIGCYSNPGEMLRWHWSSFPPLVHRDVSLSFQLNINWNWYFYTI